MKQEILNLIKEYEDKLSLNKGIDKENELNHLVDQIISLNKNKTLKICNDKESFNKKYNYSIIHIGINEIDFSKMLAIEKEIKEHFRTFGFRWIDLAVTSPSYRKFIYLPDKQDYIEDFVSGEYSYTEFLYDVKNIFSKLF